MIQPTFYKFKNLEIIQYLTQVLDMVNKVDINSLLLTEPVNALNVKLATLQEVYKQTQGSSITKELQEIDARRDNAIIGIRGVISSYLYHYTPNVVIAAEQLLATIDKHGVGIARRTYNEQTGIINSILKDIEKENVLTEAVTTLQLTTWINELKDANTVFNTKFVERVEETVVNPTVNFAGLRLEAITMFQGLTDYVKAYDTLTDNPVYKEILDKVDSLTISYHQTIEGRLNSPSEDEISNDTSVDESSSEEDTPTVL